MTADAVGSAGPRPARRIGAMRRARASSARPPAGAAATGTPTAIASRTTFGKPSAGDGMDDDVGRRQRLEVGAAIGDEAAPVDPAGHAKPLGSLLRRTSGRPLAEHHEFGVGQRGQEGEQRVEALARGDPTGPRDPDRLTWASTGSADGSRTSDGSTRLATMPSPSTMSRPTTIRRSPAARRPMPSYAAPTPIAPSLRSGIARLGRGHPPRAARDPAEARRPGPAPRVGPPGRHSTPAP